MDEWEGSDDGLDTDEEKEKKEFKISDMDEWEGSDDGLDTDEEKEKKDDSDDDGKGKKRSKDTKKKKKKEVEDEAFDDSEDDDRQDREVDYMSDESSDSDDEEEGKGKKKGSTNNSRSGTPTKDVEKSDKAEKRKAMVANLLDPNAEAPAKKSRLEQFGAAAPAAMQGNEAISEEAVRRYLKRRPMTTTDLLKKFRSKKTGIQNAQLVQLLANILKKINPHKQKVKGVTYLSLKEEK